MKDTTVSKNWFTSRGVPRQGIPKILLSVSHETLTKLEAYVEMVKKWNKAVKLVGQNDYHILWPRHVCDSALLLEGLSHYPKKWLDLGSGGGFPGLVLAILGVENMHLVERNSKKSCFLKEAVRQLGLAATVHHNRVEQLTHLGTFPFISARGMGKLHDLLPLITPFMNSDTIALIPSARKIQPQKFAPFKISSIPSPLYRHHVILKIKRTSS